MISVYLKKGREKPIQNGNPWVYSGSIQKVQCDSAEIPGTPCRVLSWTGAYIGTGYYNSRSSISVRILNTEDAPFNENVLEDRIISAQNLRCHIIDPETDSFRLVNSEGDFLPGLVIDRFGKGLLFQIHTAGMEFYKPSIIKILKRKFNPQFIFERSDGPFITEENLQATVFLHDGTIPEPLIIHESGLKFQISLTEGQKTGFYFDQRENRQLIQRYAHKRNILDCFSYTSSFGIYALSAGALQVKSIEGSSSNIEMAKINVKLNFPSSPIQFINENVFKFLRDDCSFYDLVVLDPPKFAKNRGNVEKAARGYKDINRLAIKRLNPDGILFTFSCSQLIDRKLFRQILFAAAADAKRPIQVLNVLSQGPDHPVNLAHIEGEYLKGLVLRAL